MHVSILKKWYDNSFGAPIFQSGLDSLTEVYLSLLYREERMSTQNANDEEGTDSDNSVVSNIRLDGMFSSDDSDEQNPSNSARIVILKKDLENEMRLFAAIVTSQEFRKMKSSNRSFWSKQSTSIPLLSALAKRTLNIQASSAVVERFFSICGVICGKREMNTSDELLIMKSVLKTNIELLNELSTQSTTQ